MFIVISPTNPAPMYKQLTEQIKDAITSGKMKPGEKLPSIRELTEELKISTITIKRAYTDLENEGFIITRAGIGSYIADIDIHTFRSIRMEEIRKEIKKLLSTGKKANISADEIISIIKEESGGTDNV